MSDHQWRHVTLPCGECKGGGLSTVFRCVTLDCPSCGGTGTRSVLVAGKSISRHGWHEWIKTLDPIGEPITDPDSNDLARMNDRDAEAYCLWLFEQDSEPCGGCVGSGIYSADEGTCSYCLECGDGSKEGSGRVLRVACPGDEGDEICAVCRRDFDAVELLREASPHELTITSIRPATREEIEAAQTPCGICEVINSHQGCKGVVDFGFCLNCGVKVSIEDVVRVNPHAACNGRGYTGLEYVEGRLVFLGEIAVAPE